MKKLWTPYAMHCTPDKHRDPVVIADVGSDQNGDSLYAVEDLNDDSPPALTAGEWANLGIKLSIRGWFTSLPDARRKR